MTDKERNAIDNLVGRIPDGLSPLSTAVVCDNPAGVEAALARGASPNAREPGGGMTALLFAAALGRGPILRRLLQAGGNPNSFDTETNTLALAWAMAAGMHFDRWPAYRALLDGGADVNFSPEGVRTIGWTAAARSRYELIPELLDRGYRHNLGEIEQMLAGDAPVMERYKDVHATALARVRALIAAGESRLPEAARPG